MCLASRVLFVVTLCLAAVPALAQQQASISGRVVDASNLGLPGATVTVTSQSTGFTRTVVTAETGGYAVPNLEPGIYTVLIELPGVSSGRRPDVQLTAGTALTFEFRMDIAAIEQEIVVTAEAPLIETTSNQLGGSLSSREIEEIPSNFRNFTALTQLVPGITPNPAASSFEGGQVVANGTPRSRTSTCSTACTTTTTASAAARARRFGSCSTTSKSTRCCRISTAPSTAAAPAP